MSTFERKTAFLVIFKTKIAGNCLFFVPCLYISAVWGLICLLSFPPPPAHPPPPMVGTPGSF